MRRALRSTRIIIDNATDTNWISAETQELELDDDGNIVAEHVASRRVFRKMEGGVLFQPHTFVDPMTGQEMTLNAVQLAACIKQVVSDWELEDFPGSYQDPQTGRVIIDG